MIVSAPEKFTDMVVLVGVCQDEPPSSGPTDADVDGSAGSRRCQTFFFQACSSCRWQLASKWHRGLDQIKVVRPQLIHIAALACNKRV